jgi:outer membrane protein OmpA-like peptidoglycan-associated protein
MKLISFLPLLFISTLLSAQKQTEMVVHFDFDKANIKPADARLLDSLVGTFSAGTKNISIEIYGHCDGWGRNGYNDTLSVKRAKAVKKYLVHKGLTNSIIVKTEGRGSTMPLNDEHNKIQRAENRRVELVITEDVSQLEENTLSKIISDTAIKAGSNIILKNLNFVGGSHRLLESSLPTLQDLLNALQKNENLVIRIEGHICCIPDASDGYDFETRTNNLSEERAKTVYSFLINNNIKPERLSFKGFGHQMPMYRYPEPSERERILNRRVEIRIIRK